MLGLLYLWNSLCPSTGSSVGAGRVFNNCHLFIFTFKFTFTFLLSYIISINCQCVYMRFVCLQFASMNLYFSYFFFLFDYCEYKIYHGIDSECIFIVDGVYECTFTYHIACLYYTSVTNHDDTSRPNLISLTNFFFKYNLNTNN